MSPFGPFRRLGPTDRFAARMAALAILLIVACAALALGYLGQRNAGQARDTANQANQAAADATRAIAGSCQFYHDIASVTVTPTSTKALLTIIGDARVAYEVAGCPRTKGELPKPDKRVVPYLPPGFN